MATIYDGSRVFTAVAGQPAASSEQNTFQDKMILGMEERYITVPIQSAQASAGWSWVDVQTSNPPYWSCTAAPPLNNDLLIPLPYTPAETYITEIGVIVDGNVQAGDLTQGSINLWEQPINATPSAAAAPAAGAVAIESGNPGAPWQLASTVTEHTSGAITFETVAKKQYFVHFEAASTVGPARVQYVYGVWYSAWFHKGT